MFLRQKNPGRKARARRKSFSGDGQRADKKRRAAKTAAAGLAELKVVSDRRHRPQQLVEVAGHGDLIHRAAGRPPSIR